MPCIGWTNINISFVFEVGVLLEDRSKVERANMVGLRWNKLNQSFNTTSYVKKLHQRFTYHHYHQYHKFLLIIIMTGGPYCIFLIINLTKSLTSIQTIWFAEILHYLPKAENEFSLFFPSSSYLDLSQFVAASLSQKCTTSSPSPWGFLNKSRQLSFNLFNPDQSDRFTGLFLQLFLPNFHKKNPKKL